MAKAILLDTPSFRAYKASIGSAECRRQVGKVYLLIHPDKFGRQFGCARPDHTTRDGVAHQLTLWFQNETAVTCP